MEILHPVPCCEPCPDCCRPIARGQRTVHTAFCPGRDQARSRIEFSYPRSGRVLHAVGFIVSLLLAVAGGTFVLWMCAITGEWGMIGLGLALLCVIWIGTAGHALNGLVFLSTRYRLDQDGLYVDSALFCRRILWRDVQESRIMRTPFGKFVSMRMRLGDGSEIIVHEAQETGRRHGRITLGRFIVAQLQAHGVAVRECGYQWACWDCGNQATPFLREWLRCRGHRMALVRRLVQ